MLDIALTALQCAAWIFGGLMLYVVCGDDY